MLARMRSRIATAVLAAALAMAPSRAWADLTAFVGVNPTPSNRTATGLALGFGVLVVGVEFEYAHSRADEAALAPSLKTGMVNLLVQTPVPLAGIQFYGTIGGGGYQEQLGDRSETHFGTNIGGGVKVALAGPLRLRLDYRLFNLQGEPLESRPQRFYAGVNLTF
jgi:opacity protein-like surface antigen